MIYRNGFTIDDGPLRSFEAKASQLFINDIIDGFFPYELKNKYPEGGILIISRI